METKGKESGSVKEKKPMFPLHPRPINSIPRRRSLGPTAIPIPSSHDNHRQIPNNVKPTKSLNTDPSSKNHSRKLPSTTTTTDATHKSVVGRRRSFDKPPSPSQLPKPLTNPNPREQKIQSSSSLKARTTSSLQRPMKEKLSKPSSTLPKSEPERLSKITSYSSKLAPERSSNPSTKDEKPHSSKILSKNVRKHTYATNATTITRVKQKNTISTSSSTRKARDTTIAEFPHMVEDSKLKHRLQDQGSCIVESGNEIVNVDKLPEEIFILENKGDLNIVLDDHVSNQQGDNQVNPTASDYQNVAPIIEMDESEGLEFHEAHFSECKYKDKLGGDINSKKLKDKENMCYKQETIPNEAEDNKQKKELACVETSLDENIKYETMEEKGTIVDEGIKKDTQNSKETNEVKLEKENLNVLARRQGKKDSLAYNDVIEETASRLREQRINKVLALVGAFETVISLEDPVGETSLPK